MDLAISAWAGGTAAVCMLVSGQASLAQSVVGGAQVATRTGATATPAGLFDIVGDSARDAQDQNQVVWTGNVEVVQGQTLLKTPRLVVTYTAKSASDKDAATGDRKVERIEADGPVYYITPTQKASGDHGVYTAADDTIVLSGNVTVLDGKNVSHGEHLTLHRQTGHSILAGDPDPASPKHRMRTVLYTSDSAPAPNGRPK